MKVAIAGFGIEGRESYAYFKAQYEHDIVILDERTQVDDLPSEAEVQLGHGVYDSLAEYDMVVRTAGLSPHRLATARQVWSATNEFFARCPAPIIGVTGTKGKGTTSSLIASILRASGKTVHLVGNIGLPALRVLGKIKPSDVVVYELSSFQLWDIQKSPHIAVVLMIETDHQDVHTSFDEYVGAKANIVRYQKSEDICIYNNINLPAQLIGRTAQANVHEAYVGEAAVVQRRRGEDDVECFYYKNERICPTSVVRLPGSHNLDNAAAAIAAVRALEDVPPRYIEQGLQAFSGLAHRLKYVATRQGVVFYDDSIATTPGSAIAAMRAFDAPKVLILGGSSKGADFQDLAKEVARQQMRHIVLIGAEAPRLATALNEAAPRVSYTLIEEASMQQVVQQAWQKASSGDVVILSPACASFGMFRNYQDRGEQFIAAVESLPDV